MLVVPGIGHSVLGADPSGCSQLAVRNWILTGAVPPAACPRPKPIVTVVPAYPAAAVKVETVAQTLQVVAKTLREAQAVWLMTDGLSGSSAAVPGLAGGNLRGAPSGFTLTRYSLQAGVTVSGALRIPKGGLPLSFQGTVTVGGRLAATGILGLKGTSLKGTLGGRAVGR